MKFYCVYLTPFPWCLALQQRIGAQTLVKSPPSVFQCYSSARCPRRDLRGVTVLHRPCADGTKLTETSSCQTPWLCDGLSVRQSERTSRHRIHCHLHERHTKRHVGSTEERWEKTLPRLSNTCFLTKSNRPHKALSHTLWQVGWLHNLFVIFSFLASISPRVIWRHNLRGLWLRAAACQPAEP